MTNFSNGAKKVSDTVIPRILNYLRVVQEFRRQNKINTSSEEIAKAANISAFQVRKDLTNFGKFGQAGVGYDVVSLNEYLLAIIGGKEMCNLALIGVGNLGSALLNYKGFEGEGLKFVAAFDKDRTKIGKICGGVIVEHIDQMSQSIKKNSVHIGVIAVPGDYAQSAADDLITAGISSILNFAPTALTVSKDITLRDVDLANELKVLRYFSVNK